jgi:hypothetical protein
MSNARISDADERDLRWYFSVGQTAFERSSMGGMLANAELFASSGRYDVVANEWFAVPFPPTNPTPDDDLGDPLKARPRGDKGDKLGYEPDHATLNKYGDVSRSLMNVERADPIARVALERFYGDRGAAWARIDPPAPGRIASLYLLTGAGQRLLTTAAEKDRAKGYPDLGLSEDRRLENLIAQQEKSPAEWRHALLLRAGGQAAALYADACRAWNEHRKAAG